MLNVVVFAEEASDAEIICGLADRIFEEIGKFPQHQLADCRTWRGYEPQAFFIPKGQITKLHDGLKRGSKRPSYLGYVAGKPQGSYTAQWRKAIELVVAMSKSQPVNGVLIHCDVDNKPEQRRDIEQACFPDSESLRFVLATPDREMEAWLLNGFVPENTREQKRLDELKQKLKFDPCTQAVRVRDKSGDRDPKNIINALTDNDDERKRRCWSATKLDTLSQRGKETKLANFLADVEAHFLPLLSN